MARRTVPHPDCPPFAHRNLGVISIMMPVIRPDGEFDQLQRQITPKQALQMASELLAGAVAAMGRKASENSSNVASDGS